MVTEMLALPSKRPRCDKLHVREDDSCNESYLYTVIGVIIATSTRTVLSDRKIRQVITLTYWDVKVRQT